MLCSVMAGKMRVSQIRCYFFAVICFSLITFTIKLRKCSNVSPTYNYRNLVLSNPPDREAAANYTTSNTTHSLAQSKQTSTVTCTTVNYYELYNRSPQASNVKLYVTSKNIWNGRLGNQMFKYASILGIARAQGRRMFIEPNTSLEKTFKITYVAVNENTKQWPVVKQGPLFDAALMNLPLQNVRIHGYLQSFCYFTAVMDEVRQEFTFHDSVVNDAAKILHNVYLKYNSSMIVGVHVRRGDFLTKKNIRLRSGVAEKSYFEKAFRLMKSKFPGTDMIFVVASDDLTWCRKNLLEDDVYVIPPASSSVHLAVLSNCDHMIISGGTYGWWSGWMAKGDVIYYTGYMAKRTPYENYVERYQYYPRMWIGLGN